LKVNVMTKEQTSASGNNPLLRALARWEWEGGGLESDLEKRTMLVQEEEHILQCLGAAVIVRWNALPIEIQRELFQSAVSVSDPLPKAELKEHIARFLHSHKNAGYTR
jgi:hypothetical protein